MKLTTATDQLAHRVAQMGSDVGGSLKSVFTKATPEAKEAATLAREAAISGKSSIALRATLAPFKLAWHVATRPVVWGMQLTGRGALAVGEGFKAHPKLGLAVTAGAAVVGAGHLMNKRAERNAQADLATLQTAQMQAQLPAPQANAYTVTPQEYAQLESRMRQGGQGQGFGAAVQAERAAAAQVAGPAA